MRTGDGQCRDPPRRVGDDYREYCQTHLLRHSRLRFPNACRHPAAALGMGAGTVRNRNCRVRLGATRVPDRNRGGGSRYGREAMTLVEQEQFMPSPIKPLVSLDDIEKIDVRIGTIELVEEVPRSDRLVKLTVNFGDHKRSILV